MIRVAGAVVSLLAIVLPAVAADRAAAERQYRIARRLAAEGSPDAAEALQKVIELDPRGPLADDALVDQALLEGLPRWPEELGRIEDAGVRRALDLLGRVAEQFAGADRVSEARYYRALLLLEPLPTFDASAARFDLITVATDPAVSEWTRSARYTGAWVAARVGREERAASAFSRLMVDSPLEPAAIRAAVGLARLKMREGHNGRAARLLEHAMNNEAAPEVHAEPLRELAVRLVLAGVAGGTGWGPKRVVTPSTGVRAPAGMAATEHGLLLADTRNGTVVELSTVGSVRQRWTLPDVQKVAVDPLGRIYAATTDQIYMLQNDGKRALVALLGEWGPPTALAVEATGRLWLLDRKGERVGRIEPGTRSPAATWEGSKLATLVWDGTRLLGIDPKLKDLVVIGESGSKPLGTQSLQKPVAVAVDAAGRLAILDAKDSSIQLLSSGGTPLGRIACKPAGIIKPVALAFGLDGGLNIFDDSTGGWVKLP
jgi:hypothetical protein